MIRRSNDPSDPWRLVAVVVRHRLEVRYEVRKNRFVHLLSAILGFAAPVLLGTSVRAQAPTSDDAIDAGRRTAILDGAMPETRAELLLLQRQTREIWKRAKAATVALGGAAGVLVDGGYVLTAGHVTQRAGRRVSMRLVDGRRIEGVTLGGNRKTDTGLVKVTSKGQLPTLEIGDSNQLGRGAYVLMLGYPGSRRTEGPPLRFGRLLKNPARGYLVSDCRMCAGDSGGPLVDLHGRVVGINSRITGDLAVNMHVSTATFLREWDELVASSWTAGRGGTAFLGVEQRPERTGTRILRVIEGSAAARGGLEVGDVILSIGGRRLSGRVDLPTLLQARRPGERVDLRVRRGDDELEIRVRLGSRTSG